MRMRSRDDRKDEEPTRKFIVVVVVVVWGEKAGEKVRGKTRGRKDGRGTVSSCRRATVDGVKGESQAPEHWGHGA